MNLETFDWEWSWNSDAYNGYCMHCDHRIPNVVSGKHVKINVYKIWEKCKKNRKFIFKSYGTNNENGLLVQNEMYDFYTQSALTWHFKNFEGWGHSLLQSIVSGRMVIIPDKFYKYRTASKYLIPEYTALMTQWDASDIIKNVKRVTSDLDQLNDMSYRCWKVAQTLLDWDYEANRAKRWIEETIL
jgi:hypothetical protein